jgi:hypothetical protein
VAVNRTCQLEMQNSGFGTVAAEIESSGMVLQAKHGDLKGCQKLANVTNFRVYQSLPRFTKIGVYGQESK